MKVIIFLVLISLIDSASAVVIANRPPPPPIRASEDNPAVYANGFERCGSRSYDSEGWPIETIPTGKGCERRSRGPECEGFLCKRKDKVAVIPYERMIPKGSVFKGIQITRIYSGSSNSDPVVYIFYYKNPSNASNKKSVEKAKDLKELEVLTRQKKEIEERIRKLSSED